MTYQQDIATVREAAEMIIALASGPWSVGDNLPEPLGEPMVVRSEHYRRIASDILLALDRLAARLDHAEMALNGYGKFDDALSTLADVRRSDYEDLQVALIRFEGTS